MSDNDNDYENQQDDLHAGAAADDANADEDSIIPPLADLNLDVDLVRSTDTPQRVSGLEWLPDTLADDVVEANAVLVPKDRRGKPGDRDYNRNLDLATSPLDPKMGVPSHFVSSRDGETETGNQTKHQFIQEVFVSNFDKVDQAMLRAENYDMMDVFMVPSVKNKNARMPKDMFNNDGQNLFQHWDSLNWEQVCLWQKAINRQTGPNDRTSSQWSQSFFYKSSTQELRERVDSTYKNLPASMKGGITYLYLQLRIMFHMSRDTITALKKYLKYFEEKGLRRIKGENVVIAEKEIVAVCTRLNEVNALPEETVVDVLTGLTHCSVPDFKELFLFFLQAARAEALDVNSSFKEDTLTEVKRLLSRAVDSYHALCTAGKWHMTRNSGGRVSVVVCWNCGEEGHVCTKCNKPKNQAAIEANKKKFQTRSSSGAPPHQQQRKKWGTPNPKQGGVQWFGNVPKAYCSKTGANGQCCGWNDSHSTKYHAKMMANPSGFDLATECPTHPLVFALGKNGGGGTSPAPPTTNPSANPSSNQVVVDKTVANAALANLERNSPNPDTVEICNVLRNLFSLN